MEILLHMIYQYDFIPAEEVPGRSELLLYEHETQGAFHKGNP